MTIIRKNKETWSEDESSQMCVLCAGMDFLGVLVHKKGIEINQNKTKAIMEHDLC